MTNPRNFAVTVIQKLVEAGHTAFWAGGCVRDELLGRTPKDFDVATSAAPDEVIALFGRKKTVPVGVSFGVVMVLGPSKACGQIEVATFRSDGEYLDGRRPESVRFCSPREDALRRDFTINGMFYDPLQEELLDYVGGQEDLQRKVIRAIGDSAARFNEDKLRMLRAVRFSATFGFSLEETTAEAIQKFAACLTQVSVERVAAEFRRMLSHSSRATAMELLVQTHLFEVLFKSQPQQSWMSAVRVRLSELKEPEFEPSFAVLFSAEFCSTADHARKRVQPVRGACKSWKLSNTETDTICWILESSYQCEAADPVPLHILKPILADPRHPLVIDFLNAGSSMNADARRAASQLVEYLKNANSEHLDPAPFITGRDLMDLGAESGPHFAKLIAEARRLQLDESLVDREAAIEWVSRSLEKGDNSVPER